MHRSILIRAAAMAVVVYSVLSSVGARDSSAAICQLNSPPSITSYWDSSSGTEYVFYPDVYGTIVALSCGPGGCWRSQNLAFGLFQRGSPLVSFF